MYDMKKPSKKDIQAAVKALKEPKAASSGSEQLTPKLEEKKSNKQRIRKKGV
jgi:hypothetical protein